MSGLYGDINPLASASGQRSVPLPSEERVDPENYIAEYLDWHPEYDDIDSAKHDAEQRYFKEYARLAGIENVPDELSQGHMMYLERDGATWSPAWDDEVRRQSAIALYDQEYEDENPRTVGADSDLMTVESAIRPRRHNGNELLPPEAVYLLELENEMQLARRLQQAQRGLRPLNWSDISIMRKMMSPEWESERRFTRDGAMNHFETPALAVEERGEMPQTILGNHQGANYFRFQAMPSANNIMMSGRGPLNGQISNLMHSFDDHTGHTALAMTQSGHDLGKIRDLIKQKNEEIVHGDGQYELPTANSPSSGVIDAGRQGKKEMGRAGQPYYNQGQLISNPFFRMLEDAGVPNAQQYNSPAAAGVYEGLNEFFGDVTFGATAAMGLQNLADAKAAWKVPLKTPTVMEHVLKPQAADVGVDMGMNAPAIAAASMGEGDLREAPGGVESLEGKALLDRENFRQHTPRQTPISFIREVVRERNPVMQKMQLTNPYLQADAANEAARRDRLEQERIQGQYR